MKFKFKKGDRVIVDTEPRVGEPEDWHIGTIVARGYRKGRPVYDIKFDNFQLFGHNILNYPEGVIKNV